ncbi:MAG: 16S rRNA (cytosine(1402)-N(4))-methyltransferase RsmH [bacterium]
MINHVPVLLEESVDYIVNNINGNYFDATLGFGGHTELLLSKLGANAKVICTDKDIDAIKFCENKFKDDSRFRLYNANFTEIDTLCKIEFIDKFDGILADLGVSSYQLDNKEAGFTYREDTYLDLRMNKSVGISAADVLNSFTREEISKILFTYGEERKSNYIANLIVQEREITPIKTTKQLRDIVEKIVYKEKAASSLSRVFQALRIYVNNELEDLKSFLETAISLLKPGGRIAVISYHSLEDRIVKEVFKYASLSCICSPKIPICICDKKQTLKLITKKPVLPLDNEITKNRRSRSAKLRVAEKV